MFDSRILVIDILYTSLSLILYIYFLFMTDNITAGKLYYCILVSMNIE